MDRLIAGMVLLLPLAAQPAADRVLLEAEQAREAGAAALLGALASGGARAQGMAARALGRLENPAYRDAVLPLLHSTDPQTRRAAAGALAQMRVATEWKPILEKEPDPFVRAAIFEAAGREKPLSAATEALLAGGLKDADPHARSGAARGLESLFRLNSKPPRQPAAATLDALRQAFAANRDEEIRELILLTINATAGHDSASVAGALSDPSAQVRRLAVMGARAWVRDPSPIVQYEALRAAPSCEHAAALIGEADEHVALPAIDMLGARKCDAALLEPLVAAARPWRIRAHALVALASIDPIRARDGISRMQADPVWQARVYVAKAARMANDSAALAKLARDENPNVAIAAMTTPDDAVRALSSQHCGLILAGAQKLKDAPRLSDHLPQIVAAFNRLTADGAMTVRDPRVALLTRIGEAEDSGSNGLLRAALHDRDPAVAALASRILTARLGENIAPQIVRLPVPAIPAAGFIRDLEGASARITMRGLGVILVDLLPDEAPVTVAVFAQLAEAGQYNGLTFHRIVPDFVIQGGSPGADEYDGRTREFLRDEVGFARNARGTIGISTRGRDTGDAQIYFNLVDNFRLDRDYTVIAKMREGMAVMDRVQEGNVIERIEILQHRPK